jgi:DNA-binding IclR family transcriptional regulator
MATPRDDNGPLHPVSSVENAFRILVMLRSRPSVRVSEVAAELGVARSTAHRLLTTMLAYEALEQDPVTREYRCGGLMRELGQSARRLHDVLASLRPHLEHLSERVDETVHVLMLEGVTCRFVDSVECRRPLRVTGRVGVEYPAHTTSGGKALLAELGDVQLNALYPSEELPAQTDRSLRDRTALFRELEDVRRRGYAVNRGESSEGIAAVAMAQRLSRMAAPLAIAISVPEQRMPEQRVPELANELADTRQRVAEILD